MVKTTSGVRAATLLSLTALCLALVPTALAGKGGGATPKGGTSSLTLAMVDDANGNGLPNWGDTVTFNVSTTATSQPQVATACVQNGTQVYYHEGGFYPGDPWAPGDQMYVLGWSSGGAADCTATLFYMNRKMQQVNLTSIGFHVDA
jgi:hypothetical protein